MRFVAWKRHWNDRTFHAVAEERGGSTVTHCRGRWPIGDQHEADTSPPEPERCEACSRALVDSGFVQRGLDELVARAPAVDFAFDMTDVEAD